MEERHRVNVALVLWVLLSGTAFFQASALAVQSRGEPASVAFGSSRFRIEAQPSSGEKEVYVVEEHLGRRSLRLQGGTAVLEDVEFVDGTIEFDVAFSGERSFSGVFWRMQDQGNYEDYYLRPHQSGFPDAMQYTPVFNGLSAWQLYHGPGYSASYDLSYGRWMHVKLVIQGTRGEVYIDSDEPVLVMHALKRGVAGGAIGLKASPLAPAWFSNFRYETRTPQLKGTPEPLKPAPDGTVFAWSVSTPFSETSLDGHDRLAAASLGTLEWRPLTAGPTGITNLAELQGASREANTVLARVTLRSDRERSARIAFGYSDRVQAYINGVRVYSGNNGYRSRDFRYLGTIGLFDEITVPLRSGANELTFAVSESFGGWGILARVLDADGVTIQ